MWIARRLSRPPAQLDDLLSAAAEALWLASHRSDLNCAGNGVLLGSISIVRWMAGFPDCARRFCQRGELPSAANPEALTHPAQALVDRA